MSAQKLSLKAIADAIREKESSTDTIPANCFESRIRALGTNNAIIPVNYTAQKEYLAGIAKAIREKTGTQDKFSADTFAERILSIPVLASGISCSVLKLPANLSSLTCLSYGNEKLIATVGSGNAIAYSDDGITWHTTELPTTARWCGTACGTISDPNGLTYQIFVAVSATNQVCYSYNLGQWYQETLPVNADCVGVACGGGICFILSENENTWEHGAISSWYAQNDRWFLQWTRFASHNDTRYRSITYGNDRFVVLGTATTDSDDGSIGTVLTVKQTSNGTLSLNDITEGGGIGGLPPNAYNRYYPTLMHGNGKFVAVAYNSDVAICSETGIRWTDATLPQSSDWTSGAYGDGMFVVVSRSGKVGYSTDGVVWYVESLPAESITDIAYVSSRGYFVVTTSTGIAIKMNVSDPALR